MDCPFCNKEEAVLTNRHCYTRLDKYPVTEGHTLICPIKHTGGFFDLGVIAFMELWELVNLTKDNLLTQYPDITGFNVGVNEGISAGQTIPHLHVHVIPRRDGDVADPTGGVRGVIPDKQNYIRN
jgi:diadenosine tetraphosphate (Ap4A) HIT family hydrolase